MRRNLGYRDRVLHMVGGGMLAGYALARRGNPKVNDLLFATGVMGVMEGLHGFSVMYDMLGWSSDNPKQTIELGES
ncbi:MAG: DUF2892 domain-containing protein [Firmicutes bacterium]|nr:DUF2892 domain-containing protein [Bacillota bacterium]